MGLLAAGSSLALAAPAFAASLTVDYPNGTVGYKAAAGESNQLSIATRNGGLQIQDQGIDSVSLSQLGGPSACKLVDSAQFTCVPAGLSKVTVDLGNADDQFNDSSTSLATTVTGGRGQKEIKTGAGNDVIQARNGSADRIDCGAGDDTVVADSQDTVATNCEHVDLGSGATTGPVAPTDGSSGTSSTSGQGSGDSQTGSGASGSGDSTGPASGGHGDETVFETPIGLTLPANTVQVPRPDVAVVPIGCSADADGGCRGEISFELLPSAAHRKAGRTARLVAARGHYLAQQRAHGRQIGRRSFKLAAGQSTKLPVHIAFRGHFSLASKRQRHNRAVMKVVERDSAGKVVDTQTRVITLRARTNKWSRIPRRGK